MLRGDEIIVVGSKDISLNIVKLKFDNDNYTVNNLYNKILNNKIMLHSCLFQENNIYILDSFNNTLIKYNISSDEYLECYTGKDPRHICKHKDYVYVTNFESDSIAIIDDESCTLVGTITVSPKPHDILVNKMNNNLYIACYEENEILEYNINKSEKKHLSIDGKPMHLILYDNYLFVLAYQINGNTSSEIYIIDLDSYEVEKKFVINEITSDFSYDHDTDSLIILAVESGTVYSIDLDSGEIKNKMHIAGYLESVFVGDEYLCLANSSKNDITIINKFSFEEVKNISLNFSPIYIDKL